MKSFKDLKIRIFADGANIDSMIALSAVDHIQGLTTNPTLMKQSGITDYQKFAHEVLEKITDKPISFEVFADDFDEMRRQALLIASWGANVYVKIPVTTTNGTDCSELIRGLSSEGVKLNVTALLTTDQVRMVRNHLDPETPAVVSVFAGRIADTGRDPVPIMVESLEILRPLPRAELLWASPRELLNIVQADEVGCHIITVTPDLLKKLELVGKDLSEFSLETVQMFHRDARDAGFTL